MTLEIRSATEADVATVLSLWSRSTLSEPGLGDERAIAHLLGAGSGFILMAMADNVLIGTLVAGDDGWRGAFYRLYVDEAHRQVGVGTALVHAAEAKLRNHGVGRIACLVFTDDLRAQSFWTALGYDMTTGTDRWARNLE